MTDPQDGGDHTWSVDEQGFVVGTIELAGGLPPEEPDGDELYGLHLWDQEREP